MEKKLMRKGSERNSLSATLCPYLSAWHRAVSSLHQTAMPVTENDSPALLLGLKVLLALEVPEDPIRRQH